MCGIVGYIGTGNAKDIIITGLKTLEYRGYDSAGLALLDKEIKIYREVGKITNLEDSLPQDLNANIGIGHTRWATHGKPTIENSHPHHSMNKYITLVHNGVIENYLEIKNNLIKKGYTFYSQTDTEVIVNLLEDRYLELKDMNKAIESIMNIMHGSYALGIICKDYPDEIFCMKNKTPMLAGIGQGFNMIGSDAMAMIKETNEFYEINDMEYLIIDKNSINIFDKDGNKIKRDSFISKVNNQDLNLGLYDHYMLKEIDEQPSVIRKIISEYVIDNKLQIEQEVKDELDNADRIYIIASGTSMHAGLVGKYMIEHLASKPVEVHLGSEFGYQTPLLSERPLFIFITQSGETADSRVALKAIKELGHKTLTITNVAGSTLAREATYSLLLHAGPEIAVASTKAYVAQTTLLALLANYMSGNKLDIQYELSRVIMAIENIVDKKEEIKDIVKEKIINSKSAFYIGRGLDYYTCLEAALKLKEISYIHTEGFASGELKHGTIALIEDGVPVIGLISQDNVALNTRSALQEVAARDAQTLVIVQERLSNEGDDIIVLDTNPLLSSIAMVVPTQLISYYAALLLGHDVDQPRNLAKSVTVE